MNCNGSGTSGTRVGSTTSSSRRSPLPVHPHGRIQLQFYGDDDLFIFINGKLVLDLGGVHQRLPGRVEVNGAGMATIIEGGSLDCGHDQRHHAR